MDTFLPKLFERAGHFTEEECELLKKELQFRKLKKNELLLQKGETCSSVWFVAYGSFCHYKIDVDGNKRILDLNIDADWVINHKSFTSRKPSEYTIEAYEDSAVYKISIEAIHRLIEQSQSFLQMGKILNESNLRIDFFDNDNTPEEKYCFILQHKSPLFQKFPQKLIASYLKITPETLSRVRKKHSKA